MARTNDNRAVQNGVREEELAGRVEALEEGLFSWSLPLSEKQTVDKGRGRDDRSKRGSVSTRAANSCAQRTCERSISIRPWGGRSSGRTNHSFSEAEAAGPGNAVILQVHGRGSRAVRRYSGTSEKGAPQDFSGAG